MPSKDELDTHTRLVQALQERESLMLVDRLLYGPHVENQTRLTVTLCPPTLDKQCLQVTASTKQMLQNIATEVANVSFGPQQILLYEAAIDLRPSWFGFVGKASRQPNGACIEIWRHGFTCVSLNLFPNADGIINRSDLTRLIPAAMMCAILLNHAVSGGIGTLFLSLSGAEGTRISSSEAVQGLRDACIVEQRDIVYQDVQAWFGELCEAFAIRTMQAYGLEIYEIADPRFKSIVQSLAAHMVPKQ